MTFCTSLIYILSPFICVLYTQLQFWQGSNVATHTFALLLPYIHVSSIFPSRYLFIFIIRTTCVHSFNRAPWFRAPFTRVFSTPRGFSSLPLTPRSSQQLLLTSQLSQHVSAMISSPGLILPCLSPLSAHLHFLCRLQRAGSFPVE